MAEILKGEALERDLMGREPLTGSIKLRERNSDSKEVQDDFRIEGVLHAGGSCICYKATRFFENSDMAETGTLKEFYPVDSESNSMLSYNLKRYDIDAGELAKQLYSQESTLSNFVNAQQEFRSCYEKISDLKLDNEKNDNFFQPIRIYRGIPAEAGSGNHTIYIWNPGDSSLESFDDYLSEMHQRVKEEINNPKGDLNLSLAQQLHTILQAIKALATGVQNIHMANLLHLDIKPSNFGIRKVGDSVSVSLFDVNTIYSRTNPLARTGGTPYFRAPEITGDVRNNYNHLEVGALSDVYSLGATLYNSIILFSDDRGLYETKDFSNIDACLSRSLLMEYSEYNSKADVHDALVNILKRSLARTVFDYFSGVENYYSVGGFISDITAVDEMVQKQIAMALEAGTQNIATLRLDNKEDYYDGEIKGGAVSSMQCLLYDRPLYNYTDGQGKLNLLILGAGVFGQKFIDIAFELSQISNCYLNITVLTNEKEKDEIRYLNSRHEFTKFFCLNGQKPKYDSYGSYGSIRFVQIKSKDSEGFSMESDNNIAVLNETLGAEEKFSYAFISLSDDQLNRKIACDLVASDKISPVNDKKAIINFVTYKEPGKDSKTKKTKAGKKADAFGKTFENSLKKAEENGVELNPFAVKSTLLNHRAYRFLSAMAFNCHLLWGDGLNVDINKYYGSFRSPYYYTGSFANALSVKYKLHSIGLELDSVTDEHSRSERAAKLRQLTLRYREKIGVGKTKSQKTPEQIKTLEELTMYEHRRWVTNMICSSSYEVLRQDEFGPLRNTNKDKRNRKHTCIVPSTSEWTLSSDLWNKDLSKWDEEGLENTQEYKDLDHLDKMSVDLHRHFMSVAKSFKTESIETDAGIIRRCLHSNAEALAAFEGYLISMRSMIALIQPSEKVVIRRRTTANIQQTLIRNADRFKKHLTDTLLEKKEIEKRLKAIECAFAPVIQAADYTDYKAKDQWLVYNIPFILNFSTSTRLCIPFVKGKSNNEWFENVASSLVLNPSMVTYLVDIDSPKAVKGTLMESLSNITRVMDGHNLQTKVALIIYTKVKDEVFEQSRKIEIEKELKEISPRIYSIDIIEIGNQKELVSRIKKTFETNSKSSSRFSAIQVNGEFISGAIYSIEDLSIPTFEFNSMKMSFKTEDNEDGYIWFSDIPFNAHLNIEDMFAAQGRLSVYEEPELHQDYKDIWENCYFDGKNKGVDKSMGWKCLCSAIKKKAETDNLLAKINVRQNSKEKNQLTEIFVPYFCRACIEKLFEFFTSSKISVIEDPKVKEHNSTMLKVSFRSTQEVKNTVLSLFKDPYCLIDESKIKLSFNGRIAQVSFDSLVVKDFSWELVKNEMQNNNSMKYAKGAFEYLVEKGYIIRYFASPDNETVSFCFASSQIKELLNNEGRLLELYTYYQTVEKGYFDEIKTGLEVQYKKNGDTNEYVSTQEFDLIAIKGFRTQLVEVKARRKLQQEFYQKLKSNSDKFGINKDLVLVSHTGDYNTSYENEEFILRGEEDYDVRTIFKPAHIENIGKYLTEVMKKEAE